MNYIGRVFEGADDYDWVWVDPKMDGQRFYHAVLNRSFSNNYMDVVRSVFENGLVPNDNGEVGSAIWFAPEKHGYNKHHTRLELSLVYNKETRGKYDFCGDGGTMFAHQTIPISDLKIECCPIICDDNNGYLGSNIDLQDFFMCSPEGLAEEVRSYDSNISVTVYMDLVEMTADREWADALRNLCRTDNRFHEVRLLG